MTRALQGSHAGPRLIDGAMGLLIPLLALLLFLPGGAGTSFPLAAALVQSAAITILLAALLLPGAQAAGERVMARTGAALAGFVLIVALIQLAPLSPGLWLGLPGRSDIAALLAQAEVPAGWHSLSLDPPATVAALLELLPGLALLLAGLRGGRMMRHRLIGALVLAALISAVLGALQRLSGGQSLFLFFGQDSDTASGLFVNRNHQATFLLMAMPLAAHWVLAEPALARMAKGLRIAIGWSVVAILGAGVVATPSRAGLLLLAVALAACWLVLRDRRTRPGPTLVLFLSFAAVIGMVSQSPMAQRTIDRFEQEGEPRPDYWSHSAEAARAFWPAGSGLGTFPAVYPSVEPRTALDESYINNAHNDYVESWLETGLLAPIGGLLLIGAIAAGVRRHLRLAHGLPRVTVAALSGFAILFLHSVVDYPARMMAVMAVIGLLLALLLAPPQPDEGEPPAGKRRAARPAAPARSRGQLAGAGVGAVLIALLIVPVWSQALSVELSEAGELVPAPGGDPGTPAALVASGMALSQQGDLAGAAAHARRALAIAPLQPGAASLLVDTLDQAGQRPKADALAAAAARLGWREPFVHYWLAWRAADRGDYTAALIHADALLRTGNYVENVQDFLRQSERYPPARAALAIVLARDPPWRGAFLTSLGSLRAEDMDAHRALLADLARHGAAARPDEQRALVRQAIALKASREAATLARNYGIAVAGPDLLTADTLGMLKGGKEGAALFHWRAGSAIGLRVDATAGDGISIDARQASVGTALSRSLMAPPGPMRLLAEMVEGRPGSAAMFAWTMRCEGSNALLVPMGEPRAMARTGDTERGAAGGTERRVISFSIPADCPVQSLDLNLDSSTGSAVSITLTALRIAPQN